MNRRNFLAIASLLTGAGRAVAAGRKDASCAALLEWNQALIAAVMAETPPPALTARNFALFHLALHEAAMDAVRLKLPIQPALAAAAAGVAASFYPGRSQVFEALLLRQAPGSSDAHRLGAAAARRWLDSRASDGASTTIHYVPHDEPGQWRRTPPALRPPELPHWGMVRPFLLSSGSQFRPQAPPPWDSAGFWSAADEVRRLGSAASTSRISDQTLAARFWSDFSYTPGPPGHWNEIACRLLQDRRIGLIPATRLLARLNATLADAGIACWDAKYAHNSWRPVTALRHGCAPRSVAPEPGGIPSSLPLLIRSFPLVMPPSAGRRLPCWRTFLGEIRSASQWPASPFPVWSAAIPALPLARRRLQPRVSGPAFIFPFRALPGWTLAAGWQPGRWAALCPQRVQTPRPQPAEVQEKSRKVAFPHFL